MALLQIRQYGDEILKKKAKPVTVFDSKLHLLLDDMWDTLKEHDALGLAAPQVGILRRVAIILMDDGEPYEFINPVIVEEIGKDTKNEACLSIPNKQGDVERAASIKVEAVDRFGNPFTLDADDVLATGICHEIDHLDGILFLDRAIAVQDCTAEDMQNRKAMKEKLRENRRKRK